METSSHVQYVILAQSGDHESFARLIKAMEPRLYRIAKSILAEENECLDAAQEAVIKAYLSIQQLRDPRHFQTWLIRILIHECYRIKRKRELVVHFGSRTEQADKSRFEEQIELTEAISMLEQELQLVITLHYIEDFPIREVAEILSIP